MSDGSDPYLYPGTDVLKNVPGLREAGQLAAFERYEILQNPIQGAFDAAHLKALHKRVFQDVFTWAGQFRTLCWEKRNTLDSRRVGLHRHTCLNTKRSRSLARCTGQNSSAGSPELSLRARLPGCWQTSMHYIHSVRETEELRGCWSLRLRSTLGTMCISMWLADSAWFRRASPRITEGSA